jgi:TetR/AcrR family transcriptional regulator, regulator of biofilm formation and stress response
MAQAPESQRAPSRGEGRDALCAALARIVARDGLDGVTFRSVAAEAGVTHGLASYHFGNRETMIMEALTWAVRDSIERGLGRDVESLGEFAADMPELMSEQPQEAVFQFQLALEGQRRPELLAQVRATYDDYVSEVRSTLTRLGLADDEPLARLAFAAIDGLSIQQLIYREPARTEEALARLREILASLPAAPATLDAKDGGNAG